MRRPVLIAAVLAAASMAAGACGLVQTPDPCPAGQVGFVPNCRPPGEGATLPPDFDLVLGQSSVHLDAGDQVSIPLYVRHTPRFAGLVTLTVSSPAFATLSPNVLAVPLNKSWLIVRFDEGWPTGEYPIVVTGTGSVDGRNVDRHVTLVAQVSGVDHPTFSSPRSHVLLRRDGSIQAFGYAPVGSARGRVEAPAGIALSASGAGYWVAGSGGDVARYGSAAALGSLAGRSLAAPIVGIERTPSGAGFWLVGADGGVFCFGDAGFHGSTGAMRLNQPIVGLEPTPSGAGYWLVARDGGVFAFGDAGFHGSTGAMRLNAPVVGMAGRDGGYWLVAADGGVFSFGRAFFHGSATEFGQGAIALEPTERGGGYWIATARGDVWPFGDAAAVHDAAFEPGAVETVGFDVFP